MMNPTCMGLIAVFMVVFTGPASILYSQELKSPSASHFKAASSIENAAERMFSGIFAPLEVKQNISPDDYLAAAVQMEGLCGQYPNSAAALRCIATARDWEDRGFVSSDVAARIVAFGVKLNPAKGELEELEASAKRAIDRSDHQQLRAIVPKLISIAERHPNTVSEYLSLANLPSLYRALGENERSHHAARAFLEKYPPSLASGYPAYTHYQFTNTFQLASTLAIKSVDDALEVYSQIAMENEANPVFGVPALFDAGVLALRNGRYKEARVFFNQLGDTYDSSVDDRIVLSQFKIIEALVAEAKIDEAIFLSQHLKEKFKGSHWEVQADRWVNYLDSTSEVELQPVPNPDLELASHSQPLRVRSMFWLMIGINVVAALAIAGIAVYFRVRSRIRLTRQSV